MFSTNLAKNKNNESLSHRGEGYPVLGFLSCEFHVLF